MTLSYVTEKEDFHEYLQENEDTRGIVICLLDNMAICTQSGLFQDLFSRIKDKIINDILLMFLTTSKKEMDDAIEEPKEFMNFAWDVCDKQESWTVKTEAAKCIEAFADKVDGFLSILTSFWINSIDCYINDNQHNQENYAKYLGLSQYFEKRFLNRNSPEVIIETCIMSLTITSYLFPKREDIISLLDYVVTNNSEKLFGESHVLIQARMALFLGYFSDILFKKNEDQFKACMRFLFDALEFKGDRIVVAYQSCETLNTLISDKNLIKRFQPLVIDIIDGVILNYIRTSGLSMFFDFLTDFVYVYRIEINQRIIDIIRELVQRWQQEQETLSAEGEKTNYIINHSWNVLRGIWENEDYIPQYLDMIEQEMKPIFEYAATPDKIDFDDDITLLIATSIRLSKRISDVQKTIFSWYEPMHAKYDGLFGNLLQCLNMYIVYDDGFLANSPEAITSMHNMASKSLFFKRDSEYNVNTNWDGAIVFQLILQYFKSPTYDNLFEDCLSQTTERLRVPEGSLVLKSVMFGTYLSAFIYNAEATFRYLERENILEAFLNELFLWDNKFVHAYQKKLYLIGLGQSLFSDYMPELFKQGISKIISKMILMLGRLNLAEKYKEKRTQGSIQYEENEVNRKGQERFNMEHTHAHSHSHDHSHAHSHSHSHAHAHAHGHCCDDEFSDSDEDDKIEEELKEINDYYDAQLDNQNNLDSEKPFLIIKPGEQNNTNPGDDEKEKEDSKNLNDSLAESEDYEDDVIGSEKYEIKMEYDMMKSKVHDQDVNEYFRTIMKQIYLRNPDEMMNLVNSLSEKQRDFMKKMLQTKNITYEQKGEVVSTSRRLVKVRRRAK